MIKLVLGSRDHDRLLLLLGLTRENITELTAGRPILVEAEPLGFGEGRIATCYGDDQAAIIRDVKKHLGVDLPLVPEPGPGEEVIVVNKYTEGRA